MTPRTAIALACLVLSTHCGGATFSGNVFDKGDVRYRLGSPGHGFRQASVGDNDVTYSHPKLGAIGVNATCDNYDDVPLQALLNHLLFGTTERQLQLRETVTIDGRGALHVRYRLALDGVPVSLEAYVVAKDGCVFDFTHIGSATLPPAASDAFRAVVEGFAMLGP